MLFLSWWAMLFYFILFLRSRISGFGMGFFGQDFWTFSSNWDFVSRKQSWESRSSPGSCWPLLQALWLTPSLSGYTVILSLIWESPDRQRRKKKSSFKSFALQLTTFRIIHLRVVLSRSCLGNTCISFVSCIQDLHMYRQSWNASTAT